VDRSKRLTKKTVAHVLLQRPLNRKRAGPEEFWPRSSIHRSFECLQAIDLSFSLAVAPRLSDRISHRVDVSLRRTSETLGVSNSTGAKEARAMKSKQGQSRLRGSGHAIRRSLSDGAIVKLTPFRDAEKKHRKAATVDFYGNSPTIRGRPTGPVE
jgi:hypothetical protein